ncbi:hypothetical protein NFI96_023035 [Prochilodus magdalenae]|nr:hypothetical protein NFI96_023035 [Prochilodus magdalenae]
MQVVYREPEKVLFEELRAVVFGGKFAGKTSLINAVLGKDLPPPKKRTAHCKKLQGNVCGRELTLVDTPGWWKHFPLSDTAEFLKQELVQGVSLCHPGPHAILLVIEVDIPFTEKHRKAAEDHLGLLGSQIWTHTLVVFTRSHSLGDRTIEEHIEKEGEALLWMIERCGNRYHVFDSAALNNKSQVKQLLEKIEDVVRRNNDTYFQIEAKILEEAAEWKKTVMTKATSRVLKLQEQMTGLNKEGLRIALLGWVIGGKSSAGNTIFNRTVFATNQSTLKHQCEHGDVDGRPVTVIDTPSWFKYFPSQYTPEWIKSEIKSNRERYHVFNNEERENRVQVTELLQKIDHMLARNSVFKPNPETFSRVHARKTEAETDPSGDESDLQDVVRMVDEEWRRRDKHLLKRVLKVKKDIKAMLPRRGDRSMDNPPVLSEMSLNLVHHGDEVSQTEPEASDVGTVQDEDKSTLKLKDQIKQMLDREWSRREEALMGRVLEMWSELRCEVQSEPELRAVLYGGKFAGKSFLINAVFGKDLLPPKTRTAHCEKLQGSVCGRELTLVDTPGWWKHFPLSDTPEFLKQELVQGVSLCHPGPHAILLVIETDIPFTEKRRKAAEDHLGLLGGQIWTHTLVVFTRSHSLGNRTIEQHIEKEGEALQWVIKRCGNRYHVFDIKNEPQVKQLLEKIEDVVRINNGAHFQIEAKILEAAVEWKKTVKTKASARVLKLQEQTTQLNKEGKLQVQQLSSGLRIALLGWVIGGKSSAGNTIFNRTVFATNQSTLKHQSEHGEVDGRPVTVIDTPSWFKYFPSQYTPAWIKSEIFKGVGQTDTSPHCILLVIPADTSFKEQQRKVIQENMSFLGEDVWRHTIVLFTWGDILGDLTIEEHIESEGEALQWVVEKCGNRYHVFNNEERKNHVQVTELLQKIDQLLARNSLFKTKETFGQIHERKTEADAQADPSGDESDLQDVVRLVDEEWRRRDRELLKKVLELKEDIKALLPRRGDRSIDYPPELSEMSSNPEHHGDEEMFQTEPEANVGTVQDENKSTLKLKDQIKQMLDWEWSRREEALIGRFLEMWSELRCGDRQISNVSETSLNTEHHGNEEVSQTEPEASNVGTGQDEVISILKLKDHFKEMLDRELSRRDEALMGRFLAMWNEIRSDVQSEPDEHEKERSIQKFRDLKTGGEDQSKSGADTVSCNGVQVGNTLSRYRWTNAKLRAVVFGGKFAGKSSLINAVFGKDLPPPKKRTAHCKKLQGTVCGRELTLVDTPGWWKDFPLSDTPEFLKQELVQGVSLCPPGPHVILLVIGIDTPFTEKYRKAAEDHLELLGSQIWTHTLVVFTRSHSLKDRTIEEHIEEEGEALQWVIERCGNRYHGVDSAALNNESQVKQLLEKIEDVVRRNNDTHFQIEAKILEAAAEWKKTVMAKASARELKLQEQMTQLNKEGLRIALLGWVVAGKSSAGNTILNQTVFATNQSTLKCQSGHGEVDGRPVTVIVTPSWFKYFPSQYNPEWKKSEIFKSIYQTDTSPHCILLVIPADTSFKGEQKTVIQENMSFLGEDVWRHTIVLFTWGDVLGDMTIEQHIESEGEALQWVVEKCGNRYHLFNNEERENRVQVTKLLQQIDQMLARNSLFNPNTETFGQIYARKSPSSDESDLQDVVRMVNEEWRRRDKDLMKRVLKVKKDIKAMLPRRGDRSMEYPPVLSETSSNTEHHGNEEVAEEPEASGEEISPTVLCVGTVQDKDKNTLKLKDQIKDMLDQEWTRRDEILMGRLQEMRSELGCGTVQDEVKSTLNLKNQLKEMLDREWSRREETLMGRVLEMWSELGCELRAVVFGGKFAGKSSLINAVFGKDLLPPKKRTAQCKKLQGTVCGRELTLVDTPGWWKDFPLSDTAEFLKQELIQGVSLCPPGPHVILLVIKIDTTFTEKYRKAAEDHLELLGGQIWTHTLVVFTRSHSLGDGSIKEHIEKEGEALQWVIERCGNRYHVFDSAALKNESQVKQLLEKIEDVVRRNNDTYFQIEAKILEEAAEWKKTVMTKASARELKLQEQMTQLNKEGLRIALLGWVIAGKSSAGNTIFNRTVFATNQNTLKHQSVHGEVDGRPVTVIDTPSWFKYFPSQYTPAWIKSEIFKGVGQTDTSPHCILLVIPADTSFKEQQRKVIQENMSFLGEDVWRHTIVLFTWGDILGDVTIEQHIESEGEALQWVVEKCGNRYHVFNNEEKKNRVQVTELLQKIDHMLTRNSLFKTNAEAFGQIHARKTEWADPSGDESDLQDVVRMVDEEWRSRDKDLLKRVLKVKKEIKAMLPRRGDRSMGTPPELSEMSLNPEHHGDEEVSQTEPEASGVGTVQDEDKNTLKLKGQIKEMLDREWSRRDQALMGRFLEMWSELGCDVGTVQDEDKSTLKLKDQLKEMLDREWSRREETLMGRVLEMWSELRWVQAIETQIA